MEIDSVEALIEELRQYVAGVASSNSRRYASVLLGTDDLINEMNIELIKCWRHYSQGVDDDDKLLRIAKVMISNRLRELSHAQYGTYRLATNHYDDLDDSNTHDPSIGPEAQTESAESMNTFLKLLDPEEADVVATILDPDDKRVQMWIDVYEARRGMVFSSPTITITSTIMADVMHTSVRHMRAIFRSIKRKWRTVYG